MSGRCDCLECRLRHIEAERLGAIFDRTPLYGVDGDA